MSQEVIRIDRLSRTFLTRQFFGIRRIHALDDVTLSLRRGRMLAVVGESGSGKSTLARLIMRLDRPSGGIIRILHEGRMTEIAGIPARAYYGRVQMVFQDPYLSMNPRKRIWQIVTRPLVNLGHPSGNLHEIAERKLEHVGLGKEFAFAFPHELSGGQRQRAAIARAMAVDPEVLVMDEPLSALDVSVQAQIINLLLELQQRSTLTSMFITHDLAVVRHIADDVAVMHAGRLIEYGPTEAVIGAPVQPYTQALVANMPATKAIETCSVGEHIRSSEETGNVQALLD